VRRRRRPVAHASHERWLVSYADFITLLFAFFVVLYSAAVIDKKKVGQVAASIQVAFQNMGAFPAAAAQPAIPSPARAAAPTVITTSTTEGSPDLSALWQELEQALAQEISRGEVVVRAGPEGLVVSLREIGFFDSGSAGVADHSKPAFSRMAELLAKRDYQLRIEGHTDNVPIHNSQYTSNWELSTARATEMVRLLITKYQLPPQRLAAAGYAEYHPVASNENESGRAQNRRVDVVIIGKVPAPSFIPGGASSH